MSTAEKTTVEKIERTIIIRKKINKLNVELTRLNQDIENEINEEINE